MNAMSAPKFSIASTPHQTAKAPAAASALTLSLATRIGTPLPRTAVLLAASFAGLFTSTRSVVSPLPSASVVCAQR